MSKKEALPASERAEPQPGAWLAPKEFESIVRLTPLISIDLIVQSPEGRILLGRRKNEPARNTLFVPGGRITKNETKAAAFRRITRDELGVEIGIEEASFMGAYEHFYTTNRLSQPGFGTHYVVLAYQLNRSVPADALPNDQHGEYLWMRPTELLACPEVHENTKAYFRA